MSQLKKIKFDSIEAFQNAAANGELNNETIWITPDEEPEAEIAITNVTSLLQVFDSDGNAIFAPNITPEEVIRISNITKPQFIYVDATNVEHVVGMYTVAGVSPNFQIYVIYEYNSKLYKLTYNYELGFISAVSLDGGSSKLYRHNITLKFTLGVDEVMGESYASIYLTHFNHKSTAMTINEIKSEILDGVVACSGKYLKWSEPYVDACIASIQLQPLGGDNYYDIYVPNAEAFANEYYMTYLQGIPTIVDNITEVY